MDYMVGKINGISQASSDSNGNPFHGLSWAIPLDGFYKTGLSILNMYDFGMI